MWPHGMGCIAVDLWPSLDSPLEGFALVAVVQRLLIRGGGTSSVRRRFHRPRSWRPARRGHHRPGELIDEQLESHFGALSIDGRPPPRLTATSRSSTNETPPLPPGLVPI